MLQALSCSKCGASLEASAGQQLLTCRYCQQAHVFVPPPAQEKVGTRYAPGEAVAVEWGGRWWPATVLAPVGGAEWRVHFEGWGDEHDTVVGPSRIRHRSAATATRLPRALPLGLVAAMVAILVAFGALALHTRSTSGSSAATGGPGVATATFTQGEDVDIWDGGAWWPGRVKTVSGGTYLVGFDGYSPSWDKTVDATLLRKRAIVVAKAAPAPSPTRTGPGDPSKVYRKGQKVDIHWGTSWWAGRVLEVTGYEYRITYDGWSSSHDETVDATRLRPRK